MIGKTLAHYEITSQLGKGGMGEVYRAKDQKLWRDVAIKVLPEEFAKDADRVARFQREAKLLASLNHPNIAAIHGLEESGDTQFLVLELVEGETLADRIKAGSIPVEESLKLALQIAEALEAAHEKGVIHRDLKPANIKVTPEGKIKVLDFGLAKAFAAEQAEVNLSHSPTLSGAATLQGVILGTAAYMSPEQARGKPVEKRTDIWAFGCVLYEVLTGQAAFQGEDVTEILAAVVKSGVNLDLLPANIHPRVREVITRCLQKDPKKRYRDIGDAQYEIEQILANPGGVFVQPVTAAKARKKLRVGLHWVAAALVLGAILSGVAVWKIQPAAPRSVIRFDYVLPEDQQFNYTPTETGRTLAISPDGTQIVYSTVKGLYRRSVDQLNATLIAGTNENPQSPFFSPDGHWVGYWSQTNKKLKKIPVHGGVSTTLCDVMWVIGPIWRPDHTIVYADPPKGVMRVSEDGGIPEPLEKGGSFYPQLLPDGKSLIFTDKSSQVNKIFLKDLGSGKREELLPGYDARYLPTGHLVFKLPNNINLFAVPFDLGRFDNASAPVKLVDDVGYYDVSDSGTLIYTPNTANAFTERVLVWVGRDGKEEAIAAPPNTYSLPSISPDGERLALTVATGDDTDIWIWDLFRNSMSPLTSAKGQSVSPLWTRDGRQILFASDRDGSWGIYRKAADGAGEVEKLASPPGSWIRGLCWSGDGKTLVFEVGPNQGSYEIATMTMEGDRVVKSLLRNESVTVDPHISPDGKWIAYMSAESGRDEVYVGPLPDVNAYRSQISIGGGDDPRWSPNSRELFYRSNDGTATMAVAYETEPSFKPGVPKRLFGGSYYLAAGHNWDISSDGNRFLMIKTRTPTGATPPVERPRKITVVVNWLEELRKLVPAK